MTVTGRMVVAVRGVGASSFSACFRMCVAMPVVAVAMVVGRIGASSVGSDIVVMIVCVVMGGVGARNIMAVTGCMGVGGMCMRMVVRLLLLQLLQTDTKRKMYPDNM